MRIIFYIFSILAFIVVSFSKFAFASESDGTIDSSNKYAWGNKVGWVNFDPTNGDVHVTDSGLTGYAWAANYGWINLAPSSGGVSNDGEGNLSGKAWNDKLGWLDFSGVKVDENGNFSGTTGDGSSDFGQLAFDCSDCSVVTDWRPESVRSDLVDDDDDDNHKKKSKKSEETVSYNNQVEEENQDQNQLNLINPKKDNSIIQNIKNTSKNWILWILLIVLLLLWIISRRKEMKNKKT